MNFLNTLKYITNIHKYAYLDYVRKYNKYELNTQQVRVLRPRAQNTSSTRQIQVKYRIKYAQVRAHLALSADGLSTHQIQVKYVIKYAQVRAYLSYLRI